MPFPKRTIEPVHVARSTLPVEFPLPSELEAVTNGTLANTVRQLSSLSRHAEDLFGELARDAQQLYDRSNSLQARIDRLAIKVTQLDSTVEEVSLQDIHMRKAFKSAVVFDQEIFSRATMPTAMLETYNLCDKPPPLDKLNCYRDDGKDGLKFYTDPNYFFELWRQEMINDTERVMHDKGKKPHRPRTAADGQSGAVSTVGGVTASSGGSASSGAVGSSGGGSGGGQRHKKRVRQPHNTRERQKQIAMGQGEYIMPLNTIYRTPQQQQQPQQNLIVEDGYVTGDQRPPRPNSIEIRRSYQQQANAQETVDGTHSTNHHLIHNNTGNNSHTNTGAPASPSSSSNQYIPTYEENPYHHGMMGQGPLSSESLYQGGTPTRNKLRPSQPPPAPPSNNGTPVASNTPTRSRSLSTPRDSLPPPPPPPDGTTTAPMSPPPPNGVPLHLTNHLRAANSPLTDNHQHNLHHHDLPPPPPVPQTNTTSSPPPPPPLTHNQNGSSSPPPPPPPVLQAAAVAAPPPPPPPPMPELFANNNGVLPPPPTTSQTSSLMNGGDLARILNSSSALSMKLTPMKDRTIKQLPAPMADPRNDLLKAIRDGIKLRKVEKNEQKDVEERGNGLHDVASILARRVAVEFSDSESGGSESECDSEGWGENNETSA